MGLLRVIQPLVIGPWLGSCHYFLTKCNKEKHPRIDKVGVWVQISNFMIGLLFLNVVKRFGVSRVYLGFSAVCALAVLYISNNVVETKGRSLEEIERELSPAV